MANSVQPPSDDRAVRRRPADQRRQRARDGADQRRQRRAPLHRRVDDEIDDERGQREQRREHVGAEREQREHRRPTSASAEDPRVGRRHAAVGQRPRARAAHQRVGVALVHLIQHRRAAGDQRGAGDRCAIGSSPDRAGARQVVPGRARGDDQQVQPRLGERDVVGDSVAAGRSAAARPTRRRTPRPRASFMRRTPDRLTTRLRHADSA